MKKICNSWGCTFRARVIPTVLYALISLVVTLSACTDDEHIVRQHAVPMQVSVVNSLTASRALIEDESLPGGARVGITLVDDSESTYDEKSYNNILYTSADGVKWTSENAPLLGAKQGKAVAYYPYNEDAADYTAIPVEAGTTDYMYSGWVENLDRMNTQASFQMKHAMTAIRLNIKRHVSYKGNANITDLTISSSALTTSATLNAIDGTFDNTAEAKVKMVVLDEGVITESGLKVEWLAVPIAEKKDITISCLIDGKKFNCSVDASKVFEKGDLMLWNIELREASLVTQSITANLWNEQLQDDTFIGQYNPYLILTYNVTSTSSNTALFSTVSGVSEMIIDEIPVTPVTSYKFSNTGHHIVKVRFNDETQIPANFCNKKTNLIYINSFPSELEIIGGAAFRECTGLVNINRFPDRLLSFSSQAFWGCTRLKKIFISKSVKTIGEGAFSSCTGMEGIEVDENNTMYDSRNNCNAIMETSTNRLIAGCKNSVIPDDCTVIGNSAFAYCTGLTEVKIPNSVTSIGEYAFENCTGLKEINIPELVKNIGGHAFQNCTGLKKIISHMKIAPSITSSPFYNFASNGLIIVPNDCMDSYSGWLSLEKNYLGYYGWKCIEEGMQPINGVYYSADGKNVVAGDVEYKGSINFIDGVETISNNAFSGCTGITQVTIPEPVADIGFRVFWGCTGLKEVVLPETLLSINEQAFYGCSGLTELTIPESVTSIGNYAFYNCSGIMQVNIPNSVTTIGNYAFQNCTGLTSLELGTGLQNIGNYAFYQCSGLSTITSHATTAPTIQNYSFQSVKSGGTLAVPKGCNDEYSLWMVNTSGYLGGMQWKHKELGSIPENGVYYSADGKIAMMGEPGYTGEIVIKDGVTNIAINAFQGCTKVTSVTFAETISSISIKAFYGCTGLTEVKIPNSVTSIANEAFKECTGLTSLELGTGLQNIGNYAFQKCTGLNAITSYATTAPTIQSRSFEVVKSSGTLSVPKGCKDAYATWMGTGSYYLGKYGWSCVELTE